MTLKPAFCGLVAAAALAFAGASFAAMPSKINGPHASLPCTTCHVNNELKVPSKEACLGCHQSYAKLAERTAKLNPNPHMNHRGEQNCSNCHSLHAKSRFECNDCHNFNLKMKAE